jgi:type I restriction enzyme S subunit
MAFRDINFAPSGTPIIKIAEVKNGVTQQTKFTRDTYDPKYLLQAGDMLFCWSGQPETSIGTYWWHGGDGWLNQHIFKVLPKDHLVDRGFFFQLLRYLRPNFVRIARNKQTTGLGHVTKSDLERLQVALPSVEEQRVIAATLGALDDKIESNRRAVDLIQDLSRSIYLAWRSTHPDTSEATFGSFADVFGGATPKTTEPNYWDGEIAWATPTDITALTAPYLFGTARMITDAGLASTSAMLHPTGTIFMTSRATIGSFAVTQVPAATNQGFIAVRPRQPEHRWFLFEEMRARVPEMLDRANGSTFMELSRGNFKLMPLGIPDAKAIAELDCELKPLHAKAAQLDSESTRVARLRDTLLPELLSGRIRVPDTSSLEETVA